MEDDDNTSNSSNQLNEDGDQNQIKKQLVRTNNISRKRKRLFWYDIRNFPDSLLIEILARLPVKSIFMFKSVCKDWQTLISHATFSRFYHSILDSSSYSNSNAALPFTILNRYTNLKEFVNRLTPEYIHSRSEFSLLFLSSPEEIRRYDQFRVLATSNGLILCCSKSPTPFVYYICDPLTRQWITIPRRGPRLHSDYGVGLIADVNEDHMLTGYKVVRAEIPRSNYVNLEMFSSETCEWINYKLPCPFPIQLWQLVGGPIYCYGALHRRVSHDHGIHTILAFDPCKYQKSARLIPLPEDRDLESEYNNGGSFQLCGESQGTLRYFEVGHDPTECYYPTMTMWVMKDYEKGEWCCEFKVKRSNIHCSDLKLSNWLLEGWFLPLSFDPRNQNVVYLECMVSDCILSYDVLNRTLDVACKEIVFGQFFSSDTVISFVLPRWPVLVSVDTVNSKLKGVVKCQK